MLNYNPRHWIIFLIHTYSKDIVSRLMPGLIMVAVFTSLITYGFEKFNINYQSNTAVHSILGIVLGFFLVFRTNTSYDRWWEGRKVWGALVNNCRNLSMKLNAMVPKDHPLYEPMQICISDYPKALKEHLRNGVPERHVQYLKNKLSISDMEHIPNAIARELIINVNKIKKDGTIDGHQYRILDSEVSSLTDLLGMCERIKNTPLPFSYVMFMKKFIFTYIITLPFAFVTQFGYWTIAIAVLLLYILLSIELLAEEIEDPFGTDINDLPTDELSIKINNNVEEIMKQ
ncbi:bestrophin family protein [Reichenbachiella versicolor]|uniref:bestrophin family protein n=1 Tax=Reichenbachiella versicolor TaxID=1821036 RepID=UPI000D6E9903|nr:bestrophin family protein [Reichenbachiella versicolor]